MAEEQDQERTEQATAKRREDFRKKGQVAQSKEVNTALLMSAMTLLWLAYGPRFWRGLEELLANLFSRSGTFDVTPLGVIDLMLYIVAEVSILMAPLLIVVLLVGFLASVGQIGFLFSGKPLQPDFSRLDPIKGAAKFFSKRSMMELVKSLAKVLLIGWVAFRAVEGEFEKGIVLIDADPGETLSYLGSTALIVLFKSCGVLILLALVDFLFVRYEMEQKLKMTKQEQKEEFKESEGDPYLKARIRAIQSQMSRKRMMAEVPKADVIITNPTHLSVALSYRKGEMDAPQIVAKGADNIALRIREIAGEHGIPIIENKPVARALYPLEIGAAVPEEMFRAVAEILAYVYGLKRNKR